MLGSTLIIWWHSLTNPTWHPSTPNSRSQDTFPGWKVWHDPMQIDWWGFFKPSIVTLWLTSQPNQRLDKRRHSQIGQHRILDNNKLHSARINEQGTEAKSATIWGEEERCPCFQCTWVKLEEKESHFDFKYFRSNQKNPNNYPLRRFLKLLEPISSEARGRQTHQSTIKRAIEGLREVQGKSCGFDAEVL